MVTDWGGPIFLTDLGRDQRVSRLILCPAEAFDNFPPGFPGKVTWVATRTTGTLKLAMKQMRIGWLRNRFFMFGMMAAKPIPDAIISTWITAGTFDARIRRDVLKYTRSNFVGRDLDRATRRLADFPGDVLVLWSRNRVMPTAHAEAIAELTGGTLRYVDDAKVLTMLDKPEQTARETGAFLTSAIQSSSS